MPPNVSLRVARGQSDARAIYLALVAALVIGALIRGWHTWSAAFPLNDGGLFYAMVRDLQRAQYHLPAFTSYNDAHIPFGYSPFTFYLAGLLNAATGVSLFTLLRVLPFVASTACIAAVFPLARAMLPSRATVAVALVAFAIVPRGFVWLLMGGGLTRSFGYLFALLALYQIWLLYTRRSLRYVPLAAVFSALTVLSHLGTAPFVAFSAILFLLFRGRHREGIIGSVLIGVVALVLTAPWWATVIATHGPEPFLAARATGGSLFSELSASDHGTLGVAAHLALGTTGEGRFPLIWILALLGVVWCVRARRGLLPVWWLTILVLDTRAGFTYSAAPVAMLAGIGSVDVVWRLASTPSPGAPRRSRRGAVGLALGLLLCTSIIAAASTTHNFGGETRVLTALTPADRVPMRWLARHAPPDARVLVLTGGPWQIDKASEWFPVLAERVSVATVQGSEWLPRGAFQARVRRQARVTACANGGTTHCLDSLWAEPALRFTHVYIPSGPTVRCCRRLLDALRRDPRYRTIYDDRAATVFARR